MLGRKTVNTAVQMEAGAGSGELPPSWRLDVPAKDIPALAIDAMLPLFLIYFAQRLLPLLSFHSTAWPTCAVPFTHHELL